jgi:hypothetical protein
LLNKRAQRQRGKHQADGRPLGRYRLGNGMLLKVSAHQVSQASADAIRT